MRRCGCRLEREKGIIGGVSFIPDYAMEMLYIRWQMRKERSS